MLLKVNFNSHSNTRTTTGLNAFHATFSAYQTNQKLTGTLPDMLRYQVSGGKKTKHKSKYLREPNGRHKYNPICNAHLCTRL